MIEFKQLGNYVNITNGFAFKSKKYIDKGIRIIRITNVQKGRIVDNLPKYYSAENSVQLSKYKISENDILMSLTGNVGRVGIFPKEYLPAYLNQRVCRSSSISDKLLNNYLFYLLNSNDFEQRAVNNSTGVAQLNLSTKWIEGFKIPLPSLSEQKKIVAILDAANQLRQKDQQLIDHYISLSQSLFLEMFGDPMTNPMGWKNISLGKVIGFIESGWSPVCEKDKRNREFEWGILKLSAISGGIYRQEENKQLFKSDVPRSNIEVKNGDLLFSRKNTEKLVGTSAYIFMTQEKLMIPDTIFRLNCKKEQCASIYLWFLLQHKGFSQKVRLLATGSAGSMPNISKAKLEKFLIPLPSINLQNQFAQHIEKIEQQKQYAQASLEKSETLFNSLLQRAFKGELTQSHTL